MLYFFQFLLELKSLLVNILVQQLRLLLNLIDDILLVLNALDGCSVLLAGAYILGKQ